MSEVYLWICVLFVYAGEVSNSGVFEVKIRSLFNKHGRTVSGRCCAGPEVDDACTATCRTFFTLCLLHYQKPVPVYPACTFGETKTQIVGANNIGIGIGAEPAFSVAIPFSFSWPGNFAFILDAWHDQHRNKSTSDTRHIILRASRAKRLKPSPLWVEDERLTRTSRLEFSYRVTCDENYHGLGCDKWCKERDDQFGHYRCTQGGVKVCSQGWQGELCDKVQCPKSCLKSNGFCDKPLNCICQSGWRGRDCQECVTDVKCLRGYCKTAWQCICNDGWSGSYCNIYNDYCESYSPCFNGAECVPDDTKNYTCNCRAGFMGDNCEKEYCYTGFCLNDGLCEEVGTKRVCRCTKGYSGERCQNVNPTCGEMACKNNGTCMRLKKKWACSCLPGYHGHFCEIEKNECASNPCKNGGSCRDRVNGYHCVCADGFAGINCDLIFDPCLGIQCFNGGKCHKRGFFNAGCACLANYTGYRCETPRNPCYGVHCQNGGQCVVGKAKKVSCSCTDNWTGKLCQFEKEKKNICASHPCPEGSVCKSYTDNYICICSKELKGDNCDQTKLSSDDPDSKVIHNNSKNSAVILFHNSFLFFIILLAIKMAIVS
ncbi:hypothetical protein LOTGIDRAFT_224870 [Lottia gigantea]|uniref:Delta-like protein n=1 Tax=Lottia gigantea TaxID=225164 RepID=V4AXT1_LOTGI|nr:hypothetical protein LOTGIDRAFT_224870 [Lottia gigantea]ESP02353.1 hypothetical protein LOTGIDRAFT_224870 [Lottia gigantea]